MIIVPWCKSGRHRSVACGLLFTHLLEATLIGTWGSVGLRGLRHAMSGRHRQTARAAPCPCLLRLKAGRMAIEDHPMRGDWWLSCGGGRVAGVVGKKSGMHART